MVKREVGRVGGSIGGWVSGWVGVWKEGGGAKHISGTTNMDSTSIGDSPTGRSGEAGWMDRR